MARRLPLQHGRTTAPRLAGQPTNQSVAFFETATPGTVTILVSGRGLSTGAYTVETTLPGDVNGDGTVNLADEEAFAKTYAESRPNRTTTRRPTTTRTGSSTCTMRSRWSAT